MAKLSRPVDKHLIESANKCFDNGYRLLEDRYALEFLTVFAGRYYNAMIAQEEFAKAFMLLLVKDDVIPFTPAVVRAMNDHVCKQLVGMIMEYVIMHWDNANKYMEMVRADIELGDCFPQDIGSALQLLRYEKIGRWESGTWVWGEDPNYEKSALAIAEGKKDRRKQDALYVRIGKDGRALSIPDQIALADTTEEEERASRYGGLVHAAPKGGPQGYRYDKTIAALKLLFGPPGS